MNKTNPKVDSHFSNARKWKQEMQALREIVLACELTEELKWYQPCYTVEGKNIVIIHGFKDYCALLLFKGALLKDPKKILIQQTKNVQAGRQVRFTDVKGILKMKNVLKAYVKEAIAVEKSGVKVEKKKTSEFAVPDELKKRMDKNKTLKAAFHALTPGRQRGYLLYFAAPKQSKTREARIDKCMPLILDGKGLNDDYSASRK